jgi:hypothetical protein
LVGVLVAWVSQALCQEATQRGLKKTMAWRASEPFESGNLDCPSKTPDSLTLKGPTQDRAEGDADGAETKT